MTSPVAVTDAVEQLARAMVDRSDEELGAAWAWGAYDEEGLRFALLQSHHELRDLGVRLAAVRAPRTQAQGILAQHHEAYRDLTAVLAVVRSDDLDTAPAAGEWPAREVLDHLFRAEHGFLARLRYAIERANPERWSDEEEARFVAYRTERYPVAGDALAGPIETIRARWADLHVRVLTELDGITDDQLAVRTWFWDGAMPVRFRLHRFEEHLRQHTIQLDKTLAGIGRSPTEAHRLVRNLFNALAAVETERAAADDLRARCARVIAERVATLPG